jgi:hypothetical protein
LGNGFRLDWMINDAANKKKKILGGLECVGHSFAYVAHFVFLRDVWIRSQTAAVASRRATNLATHLPKLATHLPT